MLAELPWTKKTLDTMKFVMMMETITGFSWLTITFTYMLERDKKATHITHCFAAAMVEKTNLV